MRLQSSFACDKVSNSNFTGPGLYGVSAHFAPSENVLLGRCAASGKNALGLGCDDLLYGLEDAEKGGRLLQESGPLSLWSCRARNCSLV
jgi:hypothetical protein